MSSIAPRLLTLFVALAPAGYAMAAHDHYSHDFSAFLSTEADFSSTDPGENDNKIDAVADVIFINQAVSIIIYSIGALPCWSSRGGAR